MEHLYGLFTQFINTSGVDDSTKHTCLGRLQSEGPTEPLLSDIESGIGQAYEAKAEGMKQEIHEAMAESDKIVTDFNTEIAKIEKDESKAHDQGLIASIRAKLGL